MFTGIVLAAGEATRLPNKLLLPSVDDKIVVEHAMELATKFCDEVVLVSKGGPLPKILSRRGWFYRHAIQPESLGVCNAMALGACAASYEDCFFFFGDNYYPPVDIEALKNTPKHFASTRSVGSKNLDGWHNDGFWVSRKEVSRQKLAGWVRTERDLVMRHCKERLRLIEFLNEVGVRPFNISLAGWRDLGTPESWSDFICND